MLIQPKEGPTQSGSPHRPPAPKPKALAGMLPSIVALPTEGVIVAGVAGNKAALLALRRAPILPGLMKFAEDLAGGLAGLRRGG